MSGIHFKSLSLQKHVFSNGLISDMQICHLVRDCVITKKSKIFILEIQELAQKQVAISTKRNSRPTIHVKAAILSEMSPIL